MTNASRPLAMQKHLVEADALRFDPQVASLDIKRHVFVEGYWQHEEYFREYASVIRKDLQPATEHDIANLEMAKRIGDATAICLHIRKLHGVPNVANATSLKGDPAEQVDMSYYHRAIDLIRQNVSNPHFFVFSDFPQWARENISGDLPLTFVTHNGADKDYEDHWLMRQCKHFIIANSTFSWWAAWLGENPSKIITAPKQAIGRMLKSVPASWEQL